MSIIATYRRYIYQLTAGVDFLRDGLGRLYAGTYGAVADAVMEGVRQAFVQSLPGHPEQLEDSLNQVGSDRKLFKYRGESLASWSSRVSNAWDAYEQAGTSIQVLRAVNEWGHIVFPRFWDNSQVFLTEGAWATFNVWVGSLLTFWTDAPAYDSGQVYDSPDAMYDVGGAKAEDVTTLRRIVQKWKPERSRGRIIVGLGGILYDEPTITYDSGQVYATTSNALIMKA
jgi:hypothetical protein